MDEGEVIFTRYCRDPRTGKVLDAWQYGIKAWPIKIRKPKSDGPRRGR